MEGLTDLDVYGLQDSAEDLSPREWNAVEELYYGFSELGENDEICIMCTPWS